MGVACFYSSAPYVRISFFASDLQSAPVEFNFRIVESQKNIISDNALTRPSCLCFAFEQRTRLAMGSFVIRTYQKSLRHLFIECGIHVQHYCGRNTILFSWSTLRSRLKNAKSKVTNYGSTKIKYQTSHGQNLYSTSLSFSNLKLSIF